MKIPEYQPLQVAPQATRLPARGVTSPGGFQELSRAGAELGQGVAQVGAQYDKYQATLEAKAASDADSEYRRYSTDEWSGSVKPADPNAANPDSYRPWISSDGGTEQGSGGATNIPGFSSTRGEAAVGELDPYLERLQKKRNELAEGLSPRAKELFLKSSQSLYDSDYARAHAHVAQQVEQAKVDSLKANLASAIDAVSRDPDDDERANAFVAQVAGAAWAMRTSDEDGEAKTDAIRAKIAETRAKSLMNNSEDMTDLDQAEAVLKKSKSILEASPLGEEARPLMKEVERRQLAINQKRELYAADATATRIANEASDPETGWIDDAKAMDLLSKAEVAPGARKALEEKLDHKILQNQRMRKQTIDNAYSGAFSVYLKAENLDAVPVEKRNWLIDHAPEKWDELVQKQNRDRDRAKRILKGLNDPDSKGEARALLALKADMMEHPDKYADMTPETFDAMWGSKLSKSGYNTAGTLFAETKKRDRLPDKQFADYVRNKLDEMPVLEMHAFDTKEMKAHKKELRDNAAADFGEALRSFRAEKKRDPTQAEIEDPKGPFVRAMYLNVLKRSGVKAPQQSVPADSGDINPKVFELDLKPSFADRVRQLKKLGKTADEAKAILKAEGYSELGGK